MKKILLLIITLFLTAQTIQSQAVVLDTNGVTVKWTGTTVPSPYFVQANPRGTGMEWFAIVNNSTKGNITNYAKNIQSGIDYFTPTGSTIPIPFNNIVTTLVTDMNRLFIGPLNDVNNTFNQPISSWDVSNVTNMYGMFSLVTTFNQPIGNWNVANVTNMEFMFNGTIINNGVGNPSGNFNQPIGSWNVSRVTNMKNMFSGAIAFNQPIGSWNVSNVTTMQNMFAYARSFNQPIDSWNVSNVNYMLSMFSGATVFNQPIGSWNVSNVINMYGMLSGTRDFNQPIGSWNVSNVTTMDSMFYGANAFNKDISSWNVSNVVNMNQMFYYARAFNQPIGSWNVRNVSNMSGMFDNASAFNQNIGSWNVSNVTAMTGMFTNVQLSVANYDALLIGWSTINPNETPLKPNVVFSGGNSKYCNGTSARSSIISTYGWTITDGGQDANCVLDTEEFETITLKLYPNPVVSVLNVKTDNNFINQPYTIIDGLGRIVLNGKLNEVDTTINVEQLSKGIYYLKVSGNSSSKFIKE